MLLFSGIVINLLYFVYAKAPTEINNSYNTRQKILAERVIRGKIFAGDGETVLAEQAMDGDKEVRYYPKHNLFAHAVGFSTHGVMGIERLGNYALLTSNAPVKERLEKEMAGVRNYGDDLYTTFDVHLQEVASEALGIYRGAIIVMEVHTGKVLAMVSKPDFDPNTVDENWEEISEDGKNSPLVNRTVNGLYPPGSTFKIVTLLEYIKEHSGDYEDYSFSCDGTFSYEEARISCYHGIKHGKIGIHKAFAKSCNCAFADIGRLLDPGKLLDTSEKLLFNRELPVDFPYKESQLSLSENPSAEELLQTSIGQGKTLITPMHLALITSAIANGGILMRPMELTKKTNYLGNLVEKYEPKAYGRLMSGEEAELMKQFMTEVVTGDGTGRRLSGLSYTAAGKTGSAEYGTKKGDSHAWFTGFSNVEDPDIVVTVIVEGAGSGGDYAVPMAKRIFDAYYDVR
ncbi:MAG: penicillin-binding protein 2 [Lachnospiraceae bacterium]|nr:penicillin-binding protein 2 [Lachnospiraceae bacterium]